MRFNKFLTYSLLTVALISSSVVSAREFLYLARSPRALMAGDAYTARATDAFSLFYNPATTARDWGMEIYPLPVSLQVSNILGDEDRFDSVSTSDPAEITNQLLEYPVFFQAGVFPQIKFGNFAVTAFAAQQGNFTLRNAVHPRWDINYRYDRGLLFNYAWAMGMKRAGNTYSKRKAGSSTNIGFTGKMIERQGLDASFDLYGTKLLDIIQNNPEGLDDVAKALGMSTGRGFGFDFGIEKIWATDASTFVLAFSVLDIFNTHFQGLTPSDQGIPRQEMAVNAGMSYSFNTLVFEYSFNLDFHPINVPTLPFQSKIHAGVEFGLPGIHVAGGWSGGYTSYGIAFKFWPVEIMAGFYSQELGSAYKEEEGKRGFIYASLFDISFDD